MLIPQQCVHGFRFSRHASGLVITVAYPLMTRIGGAVEERVARMTRPLQRSLSGIGGRRQVEALLPALESEYANQAEGRGALLECLLAALLIWLMRETEPAPEAGESARARSYLARFSAEIERRPISSSSSTTAYPLSRTSAMMSRNFASDTTVRSV